MNGIPTHNIGFVYGDGTVCNFADYGRGLIESHLLALGGFMLKYFPNIEALFRDASTDHGMKNETKSKRKKNQHSFFFFFFAELVPYKLSGGAATITCEGQPSVYLVEHDRAYEYCFYFRQLAPRGITFNFFFFKMKRFKF